MENPDVFCGDKAKVLVPFVLAAGTSMKALSLLLIPSVALLVSACDPGPNYGGGPGYYGHDTVYVQGHDYDHGGYDHQNDSQYNRSVTNVTDVNVNRTNVNDRTVDRTNVNQVNLKTQAKGKQTAEAKRKTSHKPSQQGTDNQQGQPHP
jgi:hypothetical protein